MTLKQRELEMIWLKTSKMVNERKKLNIYMFSYIGGKYMLKVLKVEPTKGYKNKQQIHNDKNMDKYAQLKRFNHDQRLQVYMYAFMYVDTQTVPVEDHFPAAKIFVENYKKIKKLGTVSKHWIGFTYIFLEDYELDKICDDTKFRPHMQL